MEITPAQLILAHIEYSYSCVHVFVGSYFNANVLCRSAAAPAPYNAPVFAASAVNVMAAQSVSIDKYPKQEQDQVGELWAVCIVTHEAE